MTSHNTLNRGNSVKDEFDRLVAALQKDDSAAADWLEETRDGLAQIFGANPGDIWETLAFLHYIWVMTDTAEQMRKRGMLPAIGREAYEQASREWSNPNARSMVERETLHALNTFRHDLYADFEAVLHGAPVENDAAKAYCRGSFVKLIRMVRLSR